MIIITKDLCPSSGSNLSKLRYDKRLLKNYNRYENDSVTDFFFHEAMPE